MTHSRFEPEEYGLERERLGGLILTPVGKIPVETGDPHRYRARFAPVLKTVDQS